MEGLGQLPRREGVGAVALMYNRQRAFKLRILQVGVIGADLLGKQKALVDNDSAGERRNVKIVLVRQLGLENRVFSHLANDVEHAVEVALVVDAFAAANENLPDARLGLFGGFSDRLVAGRHFAPAQQDLTFRFNRFFQDEHALFALCFVLWEKHQTGAVLFWSRKLEPEF